MRQVGGGRSALGRYAFVDRELSPALQAVATKEGGEKHAHFLRGSFHLFPMPASVSPSTDSCLCPPQELGYGSKMEVQLSTEPHNPDVHGLPGPRSLPPSPLSPQKQLQSSS